MKISLLTIAIIATAFTSYVSALKCDPGQNGKCASCGMANARPQQRSNSCVCNNGYTALNGQCVENGKKKN